MSPQQEQSQRQPQIPAGEYPERWRRVQAMMADRGLDFLVAYADDRAAFGPAHARWLANFPVHFEPVCVLMPGAGDPVILVGPESDRYALLAGRIADVRVLREFTHPDEDYPFARIQSLAEGDVRDRPQRVPGSAYRSRWTRPDRRGPHGGVQGRPPGG